MLSYKFVTAFCGILTVAFSQEIPALRVTTRLVEVHVVVQDKQGKPVPGLTKEDFVILDRGKEQRIAVFSAELGQAAPAPVPGLPPNVFSNLTAPGETPRNSITVVLFDRLNTHTSDQNHARGELAKFLRQTRPQEQMALVTLDEFSLHVVFGFNAGRDQRAAPPAGRASGTLLRSERAGLDDGFDRAEGHLYDLDRRVAEMSTAERVGRTLTALEALGRHLSYLPGRKNLIWISGSFPISMGYGVDRGKEESWRESRLDFSRRSAQTAAVLTNANVAVYPVDARGLIAAESADASNSFEPEFSLKTLDTVFNSRVSMQSLAEGTGGKAFWGRNDLSGAIRTALDDTSLIYVLGYQPAHDEWDGKYRPIEVRVKRPGVKVRHRRGYYAFAEEPQKQREASLRQAIWSPLEATNIALIGSAAPVGAEERQIVLLADSTHLTLESKGALWVGTVDVLIAQQGADGKDLDLTQATTALRLSQKDFEHNLQYGTRLMKKLHVIPAAAKIRVAVRDRPSGRLGTITIPLEAPDGPR